MLAAVLIEVCVPACGAVHGSSVPRCDSSMLRFSLGPDVSPMTGEQAELFELRNRSAGSCVLHGYPGVRLTHRATTLRFAYERGGGYVTRHRPQRVTLASGDRAYFLVAKYRCDGSDLHTTTAIRAALPGHGGRLTVRLNQGETGFDYCKRYPGDPPVDPGNRIDVSPVEATASATQPELP
jgi:Protein of unknown function (DUF4232)